MRRALAGIIGDTEMRNTDNALTSAPPLVPASSGLIEMLRDADALLGLMGREPLGVVGSLATQLTACANDAGAHEIANAAIAVSRIASAREGAALAGAMQRLASAMSHAQHTYQLDAA
jgi:hypothetical protein